MKKRTKADKAALAAQEALMRAETGTPDYFRAQGALQTAQALGGRLDAEGQRALDSIFEGDAATERTPLLARLRAWLEREI